nr:immunoglobulin light chain junction region [Macaca mulatta]
RMHALAFPWTF